MKQNVIRLSVVLSTLVLVCSFLDVSASKLAEVRVLDKEILMLHFLDGEVTFRDNGKGETAFMSFAHVAGMDTLKTFGLPLQTTLAATAATWVISSDADVNFSAAGKKPVNCWRKSKLNGMSEKEWLTSDFRYEHTMEHFIYLKLPFSMQQGITYTVTAKDEINSDKKSVNLTFDVFTEISEAVHINLVGFQPESPSKTVDVYHWMGDGSERSYTSFENADVYIVNTKTGEKAKTGKLTLWKKKAVEAQSYNLTGSTVWKSDFSSFKTPGTYRVAIDGIGSSQEFTIANDCYREPFRVSVLGFFYMRIGQDSTGGIQPVPRRPLWFPGKSPSSMKVYLTTMHPYHDEWDSFSYGDVWDRPEHWGSYKKSGNPLNQQAWGGHSDALDWDRHLGHVTIIYDMLLPYFLTGGILSDDDYKIAESGNGIPDILDEARNEVDFWLRLRDGKAYSHGLTNPDEDSAMYQAGGTAISAWANALNAAMLGDCFRIAGHNQLAGVYRDSAVSAYTYAESLSDKMLDKVFGAGETSIRGKDFKMMAAAFLFNLTGDTVYENTVNALSEAKTATSTILSIDKHNQLWGTAAYLMTPHKRTYEELALRMRSSISNEAKEKEANYTLSRPSSRATDNETGYFQTIQNVQRTIIAHATTTNTDDKEFFHKALILEADWSLGRNPLNIIQMTTAATGLQKVRSIENCYTSGGNDGSPGLHPGHTPYLNVDDWDKNMVMGSPSWMTSKSYPANFSTWPKAEAYFNTRYVWAHSEFTPQQTMRGKTALYGYLYGVDKRYSGAVQYGNGGNNKNSGQPKWQLSLAINDHFIPRADGILTIYTIDGKIVARKTLRKGIRVAIKRFEKSRSVLNIIEFRNFDGKVSHSSFVNMR